VYQKGRREKAGKPRSTRVRRTIAPIYLLLYAQHECGTGSGFVSVDLLPDSSGLPDPPPLLDDADGAEQIRLQGEGIEAAHIASWLTVNLGACATRTRVGANVAFCEAVWRVTLEAAAGDARTRYKRRFL
jgi:hypothetical protein